MFAKESTAVLASSFTGLMELFETSETGRGVGLNHLKVRGKVELWVNFHLFHRAVGQKGIGQVKNASTVAAVHESGQCHTLGQGSNEGFKDVVVADYTFRLERARKESASYCGEHQPGSFSFLPDSQ